ncbi:hypothetical protein EDD99_7992 [Streptomyces sp. 846.5]|nr:hypothetical protein [Streptomyces sp. 846.5]TDT94084.1 hypothetical protein EDD99_7992 [Streptomyces sp. 846.5]
MGSTLMVTTVGAPVEDDETPADNRDPQVVREWFTPSLDGFHTAAEVTSYSARR